MGSTTTNAVVAVVGGSVLAVLLAVPWVARRYRRRGSVGFGDLLLGLGTAVYAVAVLAYTLLPLPASAAESCLAGSVPPQLRWGAFVDDVRRLGGLGSPLDLLLNPAAAQVVLNVALFVPLGAFARHLSGRSFLAGTALATVAGLAVSVLVEATQLTGVWGLYPCAYRVPDVDDLLANSAGALLGALAAPVLRLVPGQRRVAPDQVRAVTAGRRLLGMACDGLAVVLTGGALAGAAAAADELLGDGTGITAAEGLLLGLVPAAGQLVWLLVTGRTVGETAVRLAAVPRPGPLRAVLRWAVGIGGWTVLGALDLTLAQAALTVAALAGVLLTPDRRGLAAAAAGLRVRDDREQVTPPQRPPAPSASGSLPR